MIRALFTGWNWLLIAALVFTAAFWTTVYQVFA